MASLTSAGLTLPLLLVLGAALLAIGIGVGFLMQRRKSEGSGPGGRTGLPSGHPKRSRQRLTDALTGLITRPELEALLEQAATSHDHGGSPVAVLHVGLDNFRPVNEGYGHRVGDALLRETAQRIAKFAGPNGHAARIGGDEFAVLIKTRNLQLAASAAELLAQLQAPYAVEALDLSLTASIGIAVYPDHGAKPRLLAHAALAMRTVKLGGGGGYAVFDPAMGVDMREQAELMQDLRHAVARGELQLYYQPKIDARSLQITAAEALLRWQHPIRGMVSPSVFIPLAERHGLITEIGNWVLEEACRQAAEWRKQGLRMRVAINISGHQLRQDRLVAQIENSLRRHGVAPGRMTCEITETVAMEDTALTREAFENLRRAGLHVSIDDFGTGHSSLATLRRLPAAELKIDQAFVVDVDRNPKARSIVQAVVQMARSLGLRVVAEGVETEAQRDALVALDCDELQGYLFARPMTAQSLALWADTDRQGDRPLFRSSLFGATVAGGI
jgi:diguanylate cyclase (GGDEF)-like protein